MRRGSVAALLGLALIAGGVATAVALVPTWLPEDASQQAGRIAFTFWFLVIHGPGPTHLFGGTG